MKNIVISLIIILHQIGYCNGLLTCKGGFAVKSLNPLIDSARKNENKTCTEDQKYCLAITCTKAGAQGFSQIIWRCDKANDNVACQAAKYVLENETNLTNIQCSCDYRETDMSNAQFELPPLQKGLMCKKGELDMEGYGETKKGMCLDEDQHCFMAICSKGNEHYKTVWGCTPVASKAFISAKIGEMDNAKVNCLPLFGRKGLDFSNENFTEQMMTTTTTKTSPKRKTTRATTTTTSTTTVTTIGMEKQSTNPEESQTTLADEVNSAICAKFAMLWVELMMLIIGVPAAVHLN